MLQKYVQGVWKKLIVDIGFQKQCGIAIVQCYGEFLQRKSSILKAFIDCNQ